MNTMTVTRNGEGEHLLVGTDIITIKASGDHTSGRLLFLEVTVPSGGGPPVLHRQQSAEIFYIIKGEFEVTTADTEHRASTVTISAGDTISIPSMVWHNFRNIGQTTGKLFSIHSPAEMEEFAREIGIPLASPLAPLPPHALPSEAQRQTMMQKVVKYLDVLPSEQLVRENVFRVVKATKKDAEALACVQAAAFAEGAVKVGSGPPGYDSPEWQREAIQERIYYAIWAGERIIGGTLLSEQEEGHLYLHRIFVAPEFQGQGAASHALLFLEATLPATRWTLHTPAFNASNCRFYEKRGYKKIGEVRVDQPTLLTDFVLVHYEKKMAEAM